MNFSKITLSVLLLASIASADYEKRVADLRGVTEIGRTSNTVTVEVAANRWGEFGRGGSVWYTYEAEMNDDLDDCGAYDRNSQIITEVKCDHGSLGMKSGWILTHINNEPYTKVLEYRVEKELEQSSRPYTMTFRTEEHEDLMLLRSFWNRTKREHGRALRMIDPNYYKSMCKAMAKLLDLGARDGGSLDDEECQQAMANLAQATQMIQEIQAASIPAYVPDTRPSTSSASSTAPAKKPAKKLALARR